jgi:hypothetical protein
VTLRGRDGNAVLAAYYVPREGPIEAAELRRHLQAFLPAYMVPAHFVALPRLPLTANGKLDRRALPNPEAATTVALPPSRRGRTPVGQQVLAYWQSALGNDQLGADDNVFDHGAHSVLAVQVRGLLQARLQRDIPVVLLFQHPTPAALAAALQDDMQNADQGHEATATRRAQQRRAAASRQARQR